MKKYNRYAAIVVVTLALLKINGVVSGSWWLITAPLWAPFAGAVIVVIVFQIMTRK